MGYREELNSFFQMISGKSVGISAPETFYSTQAVFCINSSLEKNIPVNVILP